MSNSNVVVNGVPSKLFYIPDEDGFHTFYAIPENDPIVGEIEENYDGRCGGSYVSDEVLDKVKEFPTVECEAVGPEDF